MGEVLEWVLFFVILIAIIVMLVFQLMCLADLEFDYINPYDSASRINSVVMPEFFTHGVLCFLYLVTGHWVMALLSIPYLYYNVRLNYGHESIYSEKHYIPIYTCLLIVRSLYLRRQHFVDVTEIFNLLNREKKQRLFKLGYVVLLLFISLFWMIFHALEDDH